MEKNKWDENVCLGDLATVRIKVERENLSESTTAGYVHAMHCPFRTKDSIWVVIAERDANKVLFCKKISNPNRQFDDK